MPRRRIVLCVWHTSFMEIDDLILQNENTSSPATEVYFGDVVDVVPFAIRFDRNINGRIQGPRRSLNDKTLSLSFLKIDVGECHTSRALLDKDLRGDICL